MSGDCSDWMVSTVRFLTLLLLLFVPRRFLCNSWSLVWTCSGCAALCHTKICRELSGGGQLSGINHVRRGTTTLPSITLTSAREEQHKWGDSDINAQIATQSSSDSWMVELELLLCSSWQRDPSGHNRGTPQGDTRHVCISGVNNSDLFRRNEGLTVLKARSFLFQEEGTAPVFSYEW